jgi:methionyl-tRNA synthetase
MHIRKLNPQEFEEAFSIHCLDIYPWPNVVSPPFSTTACIVEPGQATDPHNHFEAESFFITKGKGKITVGKEVAEVEAGDVIYFPPGSHHTLANESEEPLHFFTFYWKDEQVLNRALVQQAEAEMATRPKRVLVTATPPTPNGDLHIGHMSGPYLRGDICNRYLKLRGVDSYFVTGLDANQSYVVAKARELGQGVEETVAKFSEAMEATLRAGSIEADVFVHPRRAPWYEARVQAFFQSLYDAGRFVVRDEPTFFCESCDCFLFEVYVRGKCPHCGVVALGNSCEECGMANVCQDLVDPACNICGSTPVNRPCRRMFFPLENYADQLRDYFEAAVLPTRLKALCYRALEDLPDIPITNVTDWGIPVPVPGFEGQTIYSWFELLPGYMACTEALQRNDEGAGSCFWDEEDTQVVQFYGFDNGYYHAVFFTALLLAHDPPMHPTDAFVMNEFYRLDGAKFSTSRNHVIWGRDLFAKYPVDAVRFFLSYTAPEVEQTNFTESGFRRTVQHEIVDTWMAWLGELKQRLDCHHDGKAPEPGLWTRQHRHFHQAVGRLVAEIADAYEAASYSSQKAAHMICELARVSRRFGRSEVFRLEGPGGEDEQRTACALELAAAGMLAQTCSPMMPEFGDALWQGLGWAAAPDDWSEVPSFLPSGMAIGDMGLEFLEKIRSSVTAAEAAEES